MQKFTCGVKADAIVPAGCVLEAVFQLQCWRIYFVFTLVFLRLLCAEDTSIQDLVVPLVRSLQYRCSIRW